MKRLVFLSMLPCLAIAQHTLTLSGPATARPGDTITITANLGTTTPAVIAAIQWTNSYIPLTSTAGSVVAAAAKQLSCNNYSSTRQICVIHGLNLNTISSGPLATYTYQIPLGQAPGSLTFRLVENVVPPVMPLGTIASTATGASVTVTNTYYTVNILSKFDLDGDGSTAVSDLNILLDQVLGKAGCAADYNGNGVCDVQDVILMQRAIQGLP